MSERQTHWETVYRTKADTEVSWFEAEPSLSLALLDQAGLTPKMAVIDVGAGASRLVDCLVARGQAHVTVLDLSAAALEKARSRLHGASNTSWIAADVTAWTPDRMYDIWHDRAAFHFLTAAEEQAAYLQVLDKALRPGGYLIMGTFAPDGPEKCSGLPVARHDAASLQHLLGPGFALTHARRYAHKTPWEAEQRFQFAAFRKVEPQ